MDTVSARALVMADSVVACDGVRHAMMVAAFPVTAGPSTEAKRGKARHG
jgi:hypothetical protein